LYDQPRELDLLTSRSVGGVLVEWASRADHGEKLKQSVAARQATPADAARGRLLLVELSILEQQPELAGPHLDALAVHFNPQKQGVLKERVARAPERAPPNTGAVKATSDESKQTPAKPTPAAAPSAKATGAAPAKAEQDLASLWADLALTEAVAARALLKMADQPAESVAYLKQKLKPLVLSNERVQTLLVNLGSDNESTWKAAYEELEYFDPRLAIDLPTLMNEITTAPARQRLVEVLSQRPAGSLDGKEVTLRPLGGGGEGYNFFDGRGSWWAEHRVERINLGGNLKRKWTQAVRSLVLLEHIGTPEAVAILREMSGGHPDAQPTKLAKEALERIGGKSN
jgi:hypothetical protein